MKTTARLIMIAALGLSAACTQLQPPTRAVGFDAPVPGAEQTISRDYNVRDVRVAFAQGMTVSEANNYFPVADIVWRGDPLGDRRAQIAAIFETAFDRGTQNMNGGTPVVLDVVVTRFHSLTERTRYTVGGTHSIRFNLTVRDANTGAVIEGPRAINADFPGLGGQAAIQADAAGQTQKVRVTDRLAEVAAIELAAPAVVAAAN